LLFSSNDPISKTTFKLKKKNAKSYVEVKWCDFYWCIKRFTMNFIASLLGFVFTTRIINAPLFNKCFLVLKMKTKPQCSVERGFKRWRLLCPV